MRDMGAKVLIADDNKPMADVVKVVLSKEDYDVRIVHDGLAAIRAAKEWKPDIILLDVMMPQMNGFEVCRRLRQHDGTSATPILLLTAKSSIDDKVIGFEAGADDYITKPFNNEELKIRVASRLRRTQATAVDEPYMPGRQISVPLVLNTHRSGMFRRGYRMTKRLFDLLASLIGLPFAAVLAMIISAAVYIDSPGPILFKQQRTGRNGKRFTMYKFRTMVPDAEELKQKYAHLNELTWPDFKITDDPRMTRVGKFLRKTSLDELPQLINIIQGDMSIVGPRPTSFSANTYKLWQTERLEITPGLTGLWQVRGRSDIDFIERVELDIEYIERQCWRLDMEILLQTVRAVMIGKGAH
jgi:lipopolysaccharide/colanic/teichoic acid biosynthesis glycosyltransferase/ActR/RegA family two-component response regulator